MVTEAAEGASLDGADDVVVTGQVVVARHELHQCSPLVALGVDDFQRPRFVDVREPEFGLSASFWMFEGSEHEPPEIVDGIPNMHLGRLQCGEGFVLDTRTISLCCLNGVEVGIVICYNAAVGFDPPKIEVVAVPGCYIHELLDSELQF